MNSTKTNAIRLLDRASIPYRLYEYDMAPEETSAITVAKTIGVPADRLFKTLVAQGSSGDYLVFVVPGSATLDLHKAERATYNRTVKMLPQSELESVTGYVHGGCSPLAMRRPLLTWVDESAQNFDTIVVSAGRRGLQMEMPPAELALLIDATYADLTVDR